MNEEATSIFKKAASTVQCENIIEFYDCLFAGLLRNNDLNLILPELNSAPPTDFFQYVQNFCRGLRKKDTLKGIYHANFGKRFKKIRLTDFTSSSIPSNVEIVVWGKFESVECCSGYDYRFMFHGPLTFCELSPKRHDTRGKSYMNIFNRDMRPSKPTAQISLKYPQGAEIIFSSYFSLYTTKGFHFKYGGDFIFIEDFECVFQTFPPEIRHFKMLNSEVFGFSETEDIHIQFSEPVDTFQFFRTKFHEKLRISLEKISLFESHNCRFLKELVLTDFSPGCAIHMTYMFGLVQIDSMFLTPMNRQLAILEHNKCEFHVCNLTLSGSIDFKFAQGQHIEFFDCMFDEFHIFLEKNFDDFIVHNSEGTFILTVEDQPLFHKKRIEAASGGELILENHTVFRSRIEGLMFFAD